MNCKLVIFDFDGTLANTLPLVLAMLDELAEKFKTRKMNHEEPAETAALFPAQDHENAQGAHLESARNPQVHPDLDAP